MYAMNDVNGGSQTRDLVLIMRQRGDNIDAHVQFHARVTEDRASMCVDLR